MDDLKFSIIIPTTNNLDYLKICLNSINKNSNFFHEIIVHVNEGHDGTLEYIKNKKNISYTYSKDILGLCTATNLAASKATTNYILYSHDDMYFCPNWDLVLKKEIDLIQSNKFYLSSTMIEKNSGHIQLDCGSTFNDFDEEKLLSRLPQLPKIDFQGSHWAPHLIHRELWNRIGGFSQEFDPGFGSDPDLNMKLWNEGVRIFKGLGNFQVYHFGSITLRKKKNFIANNGTRTFLMKWKITPKFFVKHYLRGGKFTGNKIISEKYVKPLSNPIKNLIYYFDYFICKLKYLILKFNSQ